MPPRRDREPGGTLDQLVFDPEHASLAEGAFAGYRLVIALDPARAAEQSAKRHTKIGEFQAFADKLVNQLDGQDAGRTGRGRKASDRGAYSRFQNALAEAVLTRCIHSDYQSERFACDINVTAIQDAERFDGKTVLLINVIDFSAEHIVSHYKSLADIEIAPAFHRLPERTRAHTLICFLAFVLHRDIPMRHKASGSKVSPNAALNALHRVQQLKLTIGNQPAN